MNIVYCDEAWKHGEESDERAPAFNLQVVDFITNSLIFIFLIFHVILCKKPPYNNKAMLCIFLCLLELQMLQFYYVKLFFTERKHYDFILKNIELRYHTQN